MRKGIKKTVKYAATIGMLLIIIFFGYRYYQVDGTKSLVQAETITKKETKKNNLLSPSQWLITYEYNELANKKRE